MGYILIEHGVFCFTILFYCVIELQYIHSTAMDIWLFPFFFFCYYKQSSVNILFMSPGVELMGLWVCECSPSLNNAKLFFKMSVIIFSPTSVWCISPAFCQSFNFFQTSGHEIVICGFTCISIFTNKVECKFNDPFVFSLLWNACSCFWKFFLLYCLPNALMDLATNIIIIIFMCEKFC